MAGGVLKGNEENAGTYCDDDSGWYHTIVIGSALQNVFMKTVLMLPDLPKNNVLSRHMHDTIRVVGMI